MSPQAVARRRNSARRRFLGGLVTLVALIALTLWAIPRLDRIASLNHASKAVIADGDTLTLGTERIRLKGIDAPEYTQTCHRDGALYSCGRSARSELVRLVGNRTVNCTGWEHDKYGRLLATCSVDGAELNRRLVENGWAVSYGDYLAEEGSARLAKRGLWAGEFDRPAVWRAVHGDMIEDEHSAWAAVLNALKAFFGLM